MKYTALLSVVPCSDRHKVGGRPFMILAERWDTVVITDKMFTDVLLEKENMQFPLYGLIFRITSIDREKQEPRLQSVLPNEKCTLECLNILQQQGFKINEEALSYHEIK